MEKNADRTFELIPRGTRVVTDIDESGETIEARIKNKVVTAINNALRTGSIDAVRATFYELKDQRPEDTQWQAALTALEVEVLGGWQSFEKENMPTDGRVVGFRWKNREVTMVVKAYPSTEAAKGFTLIGKETVTGQPVIGGDGQNLDSFSWRGNENTALST